MNNKFYGWKIVACLFLIYLATNGIGLNTMSLFNVEFEKTFFGAKTGQASKLMGWLYFILALPLPFVGRLLQKVSPKKLILIGAIGTAVMLLYLTTVRSFGALKVYYFVYPVFLTLAGLVSSIYIINNWFVQKRGLAIGVFLTASSFGPVLFSPLAGYLIKNYGWQQALLIQNIAAIALILLPIVFLYNKPADKAQFADGVEGRVAPVSLKFDNATINRHLKAILNTADFWLFLLVSGIMWFVIIGFIPYQRTYTDEMKLDAQQSGLIQGLFFFFSLAGKIIFGYLGDKYDKKTILVISVVNLLLGAVLLRMSLDNRALLIPCFIVFGCGFSGTFTMIQSFMIYKYAGPAYSTILGILSFIDTISGAIAALLIAKWAVVGFDPVAKKPLWSFVYTFNLFIIIAAIAFGVSLLLKRTPYNQPQKAQEEILYLHTDTYKK
jgi:MFS transporter, OFA family, oxalate/formate antiporter